MVSHSRTAQKRKAERQSDKRSKRDKHNRSFRKKMQLKKGGKKGKYGVGGEVSYRKMQQRAAGC